MKIKTSLLMLSLLLGTSHAYANRNDGYVAIVRGYHFNGTTEVFKVHDCVLAGIAEKEAMKECMKAAPRCERVETERLYCGITLKCQC